MGNLVRSSTGEASVYVLKFSCARLLALFLVYHENEPVETPSGPEPSVQMLLGVGSWPSTASGVQTLEPSNPSVYGKAVTTGKAVASGSTRAVMVCKYALVGE